MRLKSENCYLRPDLMAAPAELLQSFTNAHLLHNSMHSARVPQTHSSDTGLLRASSAIPASRGCQVSRIQTNPPGTLGKDPIFDVSSSHNLNANKTHFHSDGPTQDIRNRPNCNAALAYGMPGGVPDHAQLGERNRNHRPQCSAELFVVRQQRTPDRFERMAEFARLETVPCPSS
jgi:hypothetical protein